MIPLAAKFLFLILCYALGIVGGVFLHELGHALVALCVTRQPIEMEIGKGPKCVSFGVGRLRIRLSLRGLRYGLTRYDRGRETRGRQALVALGGPMASLAALIGFGALTVNSQVGEWVWIFGLAATIANFRIFIVAIWPIEYRPEGEGGQVWLSDGLDLWHLLRSKQ
ncbi:M50 family metallopeptidase [Pelagicoccus albus]|uniref:M50 family metallopeptidase n=1 Tax=Pelagicoccus albus TaxID=415222 RepID=A0A7X1B406_9BACT|nr:M50 family metallopeptidase [Pelagicoccus albus]MBC2605132.1 M50 family metallopeptidase [Pelagicoccus albus]